MLATINIVKQLPRHPTKVYKRRSGPPSRIVVHTTDTVTSIEKLTKYDISPGNHIDPEGCPGITYHGIVMPDNNVYQTLDYDEISWHAGAWNPGSLGIAMMYKSTDKNGVDSFGPTDLMLRTTVEYVASLCLSQKVRPNRVYGHRELKGTGWLPGKGSKVLRKTCPGLKVDLDLFRSNVVKSIQEYLKTRMGFSGTVDGIWGPNTRSALDMYWKQYGGGLVPVEVLDTENQ